MTDKTPDRKVILSKARGPRFEKQWFLELQAAILDGWRIVDNDVRNDQSMRNFRGFQGRAVLYKPAPVTVEVKKPVAPVEKPVETKEESKPAPKKRATRSTKSTPKS